MTKKNNDKKANVARAELTEAKSSNAILGEKVVKTDAFDLVKNVKVPVSAKLGDGELSVDELFALREGSVVPLLQSLDAPIEVIVDGQTVAEGELVVVADKFGVKITNILKR